MPWDFFTSSEVIGTLKARGVTFQIEDSSGLRVNGISRLSERERAALKAHKGAILKALSQPTATPAGATVAPSCAVTEPWPTPTEFPEPAPKDRLCYQCQHFQRSPYGFPLGLCQQHSMPEGSLSDVRGNRIQHAASSPVHFGCISFQLRAPDTNLCTACRNYHPVSTMCRIVNTGCPYPAIPPCSSASFEPKEVRA